MKVKKMKKLRVGFLLDTLSPSLYVSELIEFVHKNNSFDTPTLITGYKNAENRSTLKKILNKFKQRPNKIFDSILYAVLFRLIHIIEIKIAKKISKVPN